MDSLGHPTFTEVIVILILGLVFGSVLWEVWSKIDNRPSSEWRSWVTRAVVFVVGLLVIALAIHTLFTPSVCGEFCDRQY